MATLYNSATDVSKRYYDRLGLNKNATPAEIKKAYKKCALEHHPDKGGDAEIFKDVATAFDVLADPTTRTQYDNEMKKKGSKDGLGQTRQDSFKRSDSMKSNDTSPHLGATKKPSSGPIEIPSDPSSLSVKELKELLTAINIRHDDCLEKADLLNRLLTRRGSQSASTRESPRDRMDQSENSTNGTTTTGSATPPTSRPASAARATSQTTPTNTDTSKEKKRSAMIKIVSCGDGGTGKSCLIKRYCEGRFVPRYIATIGVDYGVKKKTNQNTEVKINFFDLSGHEDFKEIRTEFYLNVQAVLLTFDVGNRSSFDNLSLWVDELEHCRKSRNSIFVAVCGNKIDNKQRAVSKMEAMSWASSRGFSYYETSANTGEGVNEALDFLCQRVCGSLSPPIAF
eukprot:GILJ01007093.1.p1 GENE.GILJ01007093.1~~GILJ01007093.1.p1  ORF type:complete len:397 (-),score=54.63 GILJ01007093.1:431-1621(-)